MTQDSQAYYREYYEAHRDQLADYRRRWSEENRERTREIARRYREKNREKVLESKRKWYARKREQAKKAAETEAAEVEAAVRAKKPRRRKYPTELSNELQAVAARAYTNYYPCRGRSLQWAVEAVATLNSYFAHNPADTYLRWEALRDKGCELGCGEVIYITGSGKGKFVVKEARERATYSGAPINHLRIVYESCND